MKVELVSGSRRSRAMALGARGGSWVLVTALLVSCASLPERAAAPRATYPPMNGLEAMIASGDPPRDAPPLQACGDAQDGFDGWLESFRRYAVSQQISPRTVSNALSGLTYDGEVIALDRSQKAFKLSSEEFIAKRVTRGLVARGTALIRIHAPLLARIEARFGVAPEILVALWGLETDFGQSTGSRPCLRALATLAYDCRRGARFQGELLSALRILERGDLAPDEMVGAWAGELGQTQFLPSSYERFAVDFDGDGRADLVGSSADALASTASYLQGHGWRPHEGFLPGSPNFAALGEWNASDVYRSAIVFFASKLGSSSPPTAGR